MKKNHKGKTIVIIFVGVITAILLLYFGLFFKNRCKVSFELGYASKETPETQVITKGELAAAPKDPFREGFIFLGWYSKNCTALPYDFDTPVEKSIKLTAKWFDTSDNVDSDKDGLVDSIEIQIGTDTGKKDTDGDGLSDYTEFVVLALNPLSKDTDGNGIEDGKEDSDRDGLLNAEEESCRTSPLFADTDADGLTDLDELKVYRTSPINEDTDGDRVVDGREIYIGTDPLKKDETFITVKGSGKVSEVCPVSIEVSAETDAEGAGTLLVEPVTSTNIPALTPASYGYLGSAYELRMEGNLQRATLTFCYDTALGELSDTFIPRVYYYDEEESEFVELENQVVEDGSVTVDTTHFSIYTLRNKAVIDSVNNFTYVEDTYRPDSNNDGISDYYSELISNGTIKFDNTDILLDVLGMFGADSDDWDGDGLKNGEEIKVVSNASGKAKIQILSNPILVDSDFDGLPDFTEVKQTKTNPLKYNRKSLDALVSLENNSQYLYASHEEDWRDRIAGAVDFAVSFFTYGKYERVKDVLINYFYDYAPEETIEKNAELIAEQEVYEEALKVYGSISNIAKAMKDTCSVFESGYRSAQLNEFYLECASCRRNVLDDINYKRIKGDTISKELKLVEFPVKFQTAVDDVSSEDRYQMISGGAEVIALASQALNTYNSVCELHIYSVARELSVYIDNAYALSDLPKISKPSNGLSVACDIIDAGEELMEVRGMYSKLKANADAYNMYSELLVYIRDHAEDKNLGNAAADVARMILDESGNEFFRQLADACGKKMKAAAFKSALDVAAKESTVAKIAKGFLAAYQFTGVGELAKFDVYFEVMSEISNGSIGLLNSKITKELETFAYASEDSAWVEKYLVQLAQSRIMGEYYWHEYISDEGPVGWISSVLNGKTPDDYRKMFKDTARTIYGYANRLKLRLSKNLPFYSDFWSDKVAEDEIHIPGGKLIAVNVDPTEEAILSVYQQVLEEERTEILEYTWGRTCKEGDTTPRIINFKDITGDELPEMIYVSISNRYENASGVTDLHILSYHEGYISEIMNTGWDYAAASGLSFVLFTSLGESRLNDLYWEGDDWLEECYQAAEETEIHTYEFVDVMFMSMHPDWINGYEENVTYSIEDSPVTKEAYEAKKVSIEASIDEVLMSNVNGYRDRTTALTYQEAMDYLVQKTHPEVRDQDFSAYIGSWHSYYPSDEMNADLTITDAGKGYVSFEYSVSRMYGGENQTAFVNNPNRASLYVYPGRCCDLYFKDNEIRLVIDKEISSMAYELGRYEYILTRGIADHTFRINYREQEGRYFFYLDTDCPKDESSKLTWSYELNPFGKALAEDWDVWEQNGELILDPRKNTQEMSIRIQATFQNATGTEQRMLEFFFVEKQGTLIPYIVN